MVWHKISESRQELFPNGQTLTEISLGDKSICIGLVRESIKACAAKCPHASGKMSEGYMDALGNIVCPLHRYRFSMETGRNTSGEGYFLKTYRIEERIDGIFVGIEEKKGLFGS